MEPRIQTLIRKAEGGHHGATEELFAALYAELHRLADIQLRRIGPQLSLGTTTLLHEAYLDLAGNSNVQFPDRARFLGYAARAMRGLVIDYARRAQAQKRGGGVFEITLVEEGAAAPHASGNDPVALQQLSEALDELAALEPALAQLVDLHFFCGYSFAEIAGLRGVSERTVQRDWRKARLLLHHQLTDAEQVPGAG